MGDPEGRIPLFLQPGSRHVITFDASGSCLVRDPDASFFPSAAERIRIPAFSSRGGQAAGFRIVSADLSPRHRGI